MEDYQKFVKGLFARLNKGRKTRLAEEMEMMAEVAGATLGVVQAGASEGR